MISHSTSLLSSPPVPTVTANSNSTKTASDDETPSTFEDVLQQQTGSASNTPALKGTPPTVTNKDSASTKTASTTVGDDDQKSTDFSDSNAASDEEALNAGLAAKIAPQTITPANASVAGISTVFSFGSRLRDLTVQAAVQDPTVKQSPTAKKLPAAKLATDSQKVSITTMPSTKNSTSVSSGITNSSILIVISDAQQASGSKTLPLPISTSSTKVVDNSSAGKNSTKNSSQTAATPVDLSTLIAQATILNSNIQQAPAASASAATVSTTTVEPGKDFPLPSVITGAPVTATKEKKSGTRSSEGSFLQATNSTTPTSSASGLLESTQAGIGESTLQQPLTSTDESKSSTFYDPSISALSLAGTANVEKEKAMSIDLNFPEVELLSGSGANTLSVQSGADLHIQLSSNNDFADALKQVMHVAQITQTNESRLPMRVAMEIQTPPGAIVNVYVSRQNDQWRAQLSTNDPQALSWVQDQMSSLRQSNLGVEVRWLPPQMESSPTTSSGQDANLSWDRGGQGQSNYQQPDDQQQSGRQKKASSFPGLETIPSNPFMNTLTSLGRAA